MDSPLIIQPYHNAYQQQVVELILSIQQQEYGIAITEQDQPDLFDIENFYQTKNGNFWVALYNGNVVGTVSLLDIENGHVALRKMFVTPAFRGATHKTAYHLLSAAINWAKARNVATIYLGTTPQFLAAHRFYEKNGFESIPVSALPENFLILHVDKKFYRYTV